MKRPARQFIFVLSIAALCGAGCSHRVEPQPEEYPKGEVVGGYVVRPQKTFEGQVKQERAIAKKQEVELKKQQEEIDDIKRQEYWNRELKDYVDHSAAGSSSSDGSN